MNFKQHFLCFFLLKLSTTCRAGSCFGMSGGVKREICYCEANEGAGCWRFVGLTEFQKECQCRRMTTHESETPFECYYEYAPRYSSCKRARMKKRQQQQQQQQQHQQPPQQPQRHQQPSPTIHYYHDSNSDDKFWTKDNIQDALNSVHKRLKQPTITYNIQKHATYELEFL